MHKNDAVGDRTVIHNKGHDKRAGSRAISTRVVKTVDARVSRLHSRSFGIVKHPPRITFADNAKQLFIPRNEGSDASTLRAYPSRAPGRDREGQICDYEQDYDGLRCRTAGCVQCSRMWARPVACSDRARKHKQIARSRSFPQTSP